MDAGDELASGGRSIDEVNLASLSPERIAQLRESFEQTDEDGYAILVVALPLGCPVLPDVVATSCPSVPQACVTLKPCLMSMQERFH